MRDVFEVMHHDKALTEQSITLLFKEEYEVLRLFGAEEETVW